MCKNQNFTNVILREEMKLTHLQSSTQIIHLGNIKVLTDPWLTDGEYYGSWFHYPPFDEKKIGKLDYDFIYVSHIHPDHLSEKTFKKLPNKKPVLIHNYDSKFVKRKLEMWGYEVIECDNGQPFMFQNGGSITIYAADNCNPELCNKFFGCGILEKTFGSTQIDTLALFEMGDRAILNTNDCPYELASETIKANELDKKNIDLLLVGYAGAGPYPQCFEFDTREEKLEAAHGKERQFLNQAIKYINLVKPAAFVPFAGTYMLGSTLSELTNFRGVPSVSAATEFLSEKVTGNSEGILLEQHDEYDLINKSLIKNCEKFPLSYDEYLSVISKKPLDYDNDEWDDNELDSLIKSAFDRFKQRADEINFKSETRLVIKSDKFAFQVNTETGVKKVKLNAIPEQPFVQISLHHNLLHRLLRGPRFAHWDNAEVGSHLKYLRKPNRYERGLWYCMCFLHA